MKTITVSRRARGINTLLKQARKENLIIRAPDGDEFILAEIDDFDLEIELTRLSRRKPLASAMGRRRVLGSRA